MSPVYLAESEGFVLSVTGTGDQEKGKPWVEGHCSCFSPLMGGAQVEAAAMVQAGEDPTSTGAGSVGWKEAPWELGYKLAESAGH